MSVDYEMKIKQCCEGSLFLKHSKQIENDTANDFVLKSKKLQIDC